MLKIKNQPGFTLLEILLVVAAIAILAGIVIFAVNPNKQLGDTRNAQRRADVNTLLNAVYQYSIDNGKLPTTISIGSSCDVPSQEICRDGSNCSGLTDLYTFLVGATAKYLPGIPFDQSTPTANGTGYQIYKNNVSGRVTVCAPLAEQGITISATR